MKNNQGFTLIELLVVVVILGILSLISSGMLLNALDKSKEAAVKANMSAAESTLVSSMAINEHTAEEAIENNISILNDPDGTAGSHDEIKSPFDSTLDGFLEGTDGAKGQVALEAIGDVEITLRGFGKNGTGAAPISVKTISGLKDVEE